MINITSDIVTSIIQATAGTIQQLWVVFAFLFSVVIAFYIARKIIFMFTLSKR